MGVLQYVYRYILGNFAHAKQILKKFFLKKLDKFKILRMFFGRQKTRNLKYA